MVDQRDNDGEMTLKIPSGLTTFELPDGGSFSIDIIDVCKAIDRISEECKDKTNYEYLDSFIAYIQSVTEGTVTLNSAQADWLIDNVRLERSRQKKAVADALKSLSFTASTQPDLASVTA